MTQLHTDRGYTTTPSVKEEGEAPIQAAKPRCSARGVKKAFGAQPILRGVDLTIAEGAFAVLVGPSGCGKSTLLRLIAGLEQPDEGSIELASPILDSISTCGVPRSLRPKARFSFTVRCG